MRVAREEGSVGIEQSHLRPERLGRRTRVHAVCRLRNLSCTVLAGRSPVCGLAQLALIYARRKCNTRTSNWQYPARMFFYFRRLGNGASVPHVLLQYWQLAMVRGPMEWITATARRRANSTIAADAILGDSD
jgi:hypothetical protein